MPAHDDDRLDNPVYAALTGPHARFAVRRGRVVRYPAEVAPFFALPSAPTAEDWHDAAALIAPGTGAAVIRPDPDPDADADAGAPPEPLRAVRAFDVLQLTGESARGVAASPDIAELGPADVPEILELVAATNPGPFYDRTVELGRYVGIRDTGRLVAMAGERLHLDGFTEVSAVCTLTSHRGQGLGSRLIGAIVAGVLARDERPFLHALPSNASAVRLYEQLGFRVRRRLTITALSHSDGAGLSPSSE